MQKTNLNKKALRRTARRAQERRIFKPAALAKAIAGVFVFGALSGGVLAAPDISTEIVIGETSIGGLKFQIGNKELTWKFTGYGTAIPNWSFNSSSLKNDLEALQDDYDIDFSIPREFRWPSLASGANSNGRMIHDTSKDLVINGGEYSSFDTLAKDGAVVSIENNGGGNLIWRSCNWSGDSILADGEGSKTVVSNNNGSVLFLNSEQWNATLGDAVINGGVGIIENNCSGEIVIQGSGGGVDAVYTANIQSGASGEGSVFEVINREAGVITIENSKYGGAISDLAAKNGYGRIVNEGTGTINIIGKYAESPYNSNCVISIIASKGSRGEVVNGINGELNIIQNSNSSTIGSLGVGSIVNSGVMNVVGGESGGAAIDNITNIGKASIVNNTGGRIIFKSVGSGGAIRSFTNRSFYEGCVAKVSNHHGATISFIGNANAYAISGLNVEPAVIGGLELPLVVTKIENEGILWINKYGIGDFVHPLDDQNEFVKPSGKTLSKEYVEIYNKNTGYVYAEAGALFNGYYDEPSVDGEVNTISI